MSDHEPIYCVIKCENEVVVKPENVGQKAAPKPKWKDASEDQKLEYNDVLFRKLSSIKIPDEVGTCNDIHCDNDDHIKKIYSFISDILENVTESGFETLPVSVKQVSN